MCRGNPSAAGRLDSLRQMSHSDGKVLHQTEAKGHAMAKLPDLSRFEFQCLSKIWTRQEATVRQVQADLDEGPTYSTVRKIIDRLEEKGAVERLRMDGKAWVYRSAVSRVRMMQKEIARFLDMAFDGAALPLVAQLAEMDELSVGDLREIEKRLDRKQDGALLREWGDEGRKGKGEDQ